MQYDHEKLLFQQVWVVAVAMSDSFQTGRKKSAWRERFCHKPLNCNDEYKEKNWESHETQIS